MTRLRLVLAALLVAALAFTLAACGDDDSADSAAADTTASSEVACTKDQLSTLTAGTLTVGTDKPAFPPYVDRRRPLQRQGLRERRRVRGRRSARLHQGRGHLDRRALQLELRARREEVRLRHQPGLDQPLPRQGRRLLGPLLHDPPGRARAQGLPLRHRHLGRRPQGRAHRRAGRHHQPRRGQRGDRPVHPAARLQRLQRRRPRPQVRIRSTRSWSTSPRPSTCATPRWRARPSSGSSRRRAATTGAWCWPRTRRSPSAWTAPSTALKDSGELASITEQWIGAEAPVLALK